MNLRRVTYLACYTFESAKMFRGLIKKHKMSVTFNLVIEHLNTHALIKRPCAAYLKFRNITDSLSFLNETAYFKEHFYKL